MSRRRDPARRGPAHRQPVPVRHPEASPEAFRSSATKAPCPGKLNADGHDRHLLSFVAERRARERSLSGRERAFAVAGGAVFVVYLFTRQSNVAATLVDALGYGPTFVRGWSQPKKDSVASFALNGVKFVPSLMAMDPLSFATSFYPATLLVLNAAVAIMLVMRRRRHRRRVVKVAGSEAPLHCLVDVRVMTRLFVEGGLRQGRRHAATVA